MSDAHEEPRTIESVDDFGVRVEERDGEWLVIRHTEGRDSVVERLPDQESADRLASTMADTATRHEGGGNHEPVPDSYPGKVD